MKLRTGEPWMPAPDYGRQLRGLTINLLVRDIESALVFARRVLRADVVYADPDIAVIKAYGSEWMLHADHAYQGHPLQREVAAVTARGTGLELRVHDVANAQFREVIGSRRARDAASDDDDAGVGGDRGGHF